MCGWVFLKFYNTEVNSENGVTLTHNSLIYHPHDHEHTTTQKYDRRKKFRDF